MKPKSLPCSRCSAVLPPAAFNTPAPVRCPSCGTLLQAVVFPALFAGLQASKAGETLLVEGQSSCYYHPQKVAVVPCDECGRFLCSLCELELGDRRVCPSCLESGQRKGKVEGLVRRRVLYDSLALWLSILPVLMMWFVTFITAPAALFIAVRHWGDPPTPLRRTRIRNVLAIVFSSVQIVAWCVNVYNFFI